MNGKYNQGNQVSTYNKPKKQYPAPYRPKPNKNQVSTFSSPFTSNLANNMKFGRPGDEVSGYVDRVVMIKDRFGNEKVARERQFFNSGKRLNVRTGTGSNDKY
jgi:hypothetical protein